MGTGTGRWQERIPVEIVECGELIGKRIVQIKDYGDHFTVVTEDGQKVTVTKRIPSAPPSEPEVTASKDHERRRFRMRRKRG